MHAQSCHPQWLHVIREGYNSLTHIPASFYEQEPPAPLASSQSAHHRQGAKAKVIKTKNPSPQGWQTPL
jgi:hypothetical protein